MIRSIFNMEDNSYYRGREFLFPEESPERKNHTQRRSIFRKKQKNNTIHVVRISREDKIRMIRRIPSSPSLEDSLKDYNNNFSC
mmetsp:Transcript_16937/g.25627  ORF Transcript_16937/g.25627 Transcript_16937/m.25627 type:complete len:84 (-) Transcript_16937:28-279(-)|eukprot:CAMPEP_0178897888 /NCGR_PEP_ID=MMETSP0786-20121207/2009_1 /TAXON_ID=186022 /ORGANISM="Thalassionema frauenfeldii, Strain CCMP 1798" /LENGTH=83 /DNA_ID=CAMNT_0020568513 /DNA_START=99 /DNA_END=350 /DNA_ORIENTATION=+